MSFSDKEFDLTIEKGLQKIKLIQGTIDAVACSKNPEIPQKMMNEIFRVTSKNYIFVSHSGPEKRNFLFKNLKAEIFFKVKIFSKKKETSIKSTSQYDKLYSICFKRPTSF